MELSVTQLQKNMFERTEKYADSVRSAYEQALSEVIRIVSGTELEDGKPFSFKDYGYSDKVDKILKNLYATVYRIIRVGTEYEWIASNENNDELVKSIFGKHAIDNNHYSKLFDRNKSAMDVFMSRRISADGLNLSDKVWRYTNQYRVELEDTLDLALGEGNGANSLASTINKYLNDPDRYYRRFRVKVGEGPDGNAVYGSLWKRRVWDKELNGYKWINADPKRYHPGQGVYRSSSRNAQRLARTETNIAYRSADYERWQNVDFVVGVEIGLSNNHPQADICDDLKGRYPKHFKWTGWHPNCRCYIVPILATKEEMDILIDKMLIGEDGSGFISIESVNEMPNQFADWLINNEERAKGWSSMPNFVKDNQGLVGTRFNI